MNRRTMLAAIPASTFALAAAASPAPADYSDTTDGPSYELPKAWALMGPDERIELLRSHLMDALYESAPEGVGSFEIILSEREGHEPIIARGYNEHYRLFIYRPRNFSGWRKPCGIQIPS